MKYSPSVRSTGIFSAGNPPTIQAFLGRRTRRTARSLHLLYAFRPAPHTYAIDRWRPTSENHRGLRPILSIALRKAVGMRFVAPEKEIQTLGLLSGLGSCGAVMVLLEQSPWEATSITETR